MKGNIMKFSVLAGVSVIALFVMAGMASADPASNHNIVGVYAVAGISTCSPVVPENAPAVTISPGLMEGDYTFRPDGTVTIRNGFVRNFPGAGPNFHVQADFTYRVTRDGRITFEYPDGGFQIGEINEFGIFQEFFRLNAGPSHGVISPDGKTITISCGPPVGPLWLISGGEKVPDSDMWCITSVMGMRIK